MFNNILFNTSTIFSLVQLTMEIITSQRGKDILVFSGYKFRKNRITKTTQTWRCTQSDCSGTASTPLNYREDRIVRVGRDHNHIPDPSSLNVEQAMSRMQDQAATSAVPPRRLIAEAVADLEEEALTKLPARAAMLKRIQRKRRRDEVDYRPDPENAQDFELPERFRTVNVEGNLQRFLLHDEMDRIPPGNVAERANMRRVIVFGTDTMLDQLCSSNTIMIDGTFKVVPKLYYQLFTLHAVRGNFVIPCLYCLLPNKTQETYQHLFETIKLIRPNFTPQRVVMDFEQASMQAIRAVIPETTTEGCFFHLSQNIWRRIQSLGIGPTYVADEQCRLQCKLLGALAFLPLEEVADGFEEIDEQRERDHRNDDMARLYAYFEDTYVGRPFRRGRRTALFPPETWNVLRRTEEGLPRTSNKMEGWHRAIQTSYDCAHPSMWKFLQGLQKEEQLQRANLRQFMAGEDAPQSKRYKEVNKRIKTLIARYRNQEVNRIDYLRGVSHNITYTV